MRYLPHKEYQTQRRCPVLWRDLGLDLLGKPNHRLCCHCGAIKTPLRTVRKGR